MEIIKNKTHEVNQFSSQIGNPTVVDLNKKAEMHKALKRTVNSLDFSRWADEDGSVFETYHQLLDYQMEKYAKRYPPVYIKDLYPELADIQGNKIGWNLTALKLFRRNFDEWIKFSRAMDDSILRTAGYDAAKDPFLDKREDALNVALDGIAIRLRKLQEESKN